MIHYIKGDATSPIGKGNKIIAHICNDHGGWGAGFVLALSKKWSAPEIAYRSLGFNIELGRVQYVKLGEENIVVANMIAQHDFVSKNNPVAVRYDALEKCLNDVAEKAKSENASVHMPRIGCGLAGGKWKKIEEIIDKTLIANGVDVYVYDLN